MGSRREGCGVREVTELQGPPVTWHSLQPSPSELNCIPVDFVEHFSLPHKESHVPFGQ